MAKRGLTWSTMLGTIARKNGGGDIPKIQTTKQTSMVDAPILSTEDV